MTDESLLLLSLGPVQEFIASARRCRDLWYGSWLLSELARAAAAELGPDPLIFPGGLAAKALTPGASEAVANRILAKIAGDVEEAERRAVDVKLAVEKRLKELATDAFARVGRGDSARDRFFQESTAWDQVKELIEVQWVAVPLGDDYSAAHKRADALLAARKNTRVWDPCAWGKRVPKSSLDGIRESVLHEELYDERLKEDLYARYRVGASERLCGVGLLKRFGRPGARGEDAERFFSTSHLAALPWMVGHDDGDFRALTRELEEALGADLKPWLEVTPQLYPGEEFETFGRADGALFFDGRLVEIAEDLGLRRGDAGVKRALKAMRRFRGAAEPTPYFGVLLADGDRLGKLIQGKSESDHRKLSGCLLKFAERARNIVKEHHGSPLYVGGDDVLALVPLHTALTIADELSAAFAEALLPVTNTATLSAGLAIGHHLTPLDETLELARRAERMAKVERNNLAVIVDKRSGTAREACGAWGDGGLSWRLARMMEALDADAIPLRAAHQLLALDAFEGEALAGVRIAETARILSRKRSARGKEAFDPSVLDRLGADKPVRLGTELVIAQLLLRAQNEATPNSAPKNAAPKNETSQDKESAA